MKYISLRDLKPGVEAVVLNILADEPLGYYLLELGIQPGFEITKKIQLWFGSSVIDVSGSKYGIGRYLSKKIIVRYE